MVNTIMNVPDGANHHSNGRDCSVNRWHQKLIEEGPAVAPPPAVRKQIKDAAVSPAKAVGCSNARTAEYLHLEPGKKLCFLKLDPHLPAERPVTARSVSTQPLFFEIVRVNPSATQR